MTTINCKHPTPPHMHQPPRLPPMPPTTLPPPSNRTRRGNNMTNTTCIKAEVNANLYTIYNNSTKQLNTPHAQGELLTGLIKLYLQEHQNFEEIKEITQDITTDYPRTITLHANNINPKVHKKFIKHLQKKYNTKKIQQHYNQTLNNILTLHTLGMIKGIEQGKIDIYEFL